MSAFASCSDPMISRNEVGNSLEISHDTIFGLASLDAAVYFSVDSREFDEENEGGSTNHQIPPIDAEADPCRARPPITETRRCESPPIRSHPNPSPSSCSALVGKLSARFDESVLRQSAFEEEMVDSLNQLTDRLNALEAAVTEQSATLSSSISRSQSGTRTLLVQLVRKLITFLHSVSVNRAAARPATAAIQSRIGMSRARATTARE